MTDARLVSALTDALADIRRWHPDTADPPRGAPSQIRVAFGSRPPIPYAILSLRRETSDTLTAWALLIAEQRDLHPGIAAGDVDALIDFLAAHAAWLAGHEAARDACHELGRIATLLKQTATQTHPRYLIVGPCPEPDCTGRVTAQYGRCGDPEYRGDATCSANPEHLWTGETQWRILGVRIGADQPRGVSAYEAVILAKRAGVSVGVSAIWQWAARGHVERIGVRGRTTLYDIEGLNRKINERMSE